MTTSLSRILASRLEIASTYKVFSKALECEGDWLVFASKQFPLRVWLGAFGDAVFLLLLLLLLLRAFHLSTTPPSALLHTLEKQVAAMPKTTDPERLVVQCVGQNLSRCVRGLADGHCGWLPRNRERAFNHRHQGTTG